MASSTEHFIPFSRAEIARMCLAERGGDPAALADVFRLLNAIFHFEFHEQLEELKELYAPFDPDVDSKPAPPADAARRRTRLVEVLAHVLERANYRQLTPQEVRKALSEESPFDLHISVRLDDFSDLIIFGRALRTTEVSTRRWWQRRPRTQSMEYYERVVLFARFHDAEPVPAERRGTTLLKLFRNIPRADLEMLLPNVEVRMTGKDKAFLGVPAVVGGVILVMTKLSASLVLVAALVAFWLGWRRDQVEIQTEQLVALGLGLLTLGLYLFRQIGAFKNRKIRFMKALSDNLYFRNLDNNAGVFHRVIDDAEEEEGKEAMLAYAFLLDRAGGLTREELDAHIERWFREKHAVTLDFEIGDALAKLERLGLLRSDVNGRLVAIPVAEAKQALDRRWDDYFRFAPPG